MLGRLKAFWGGGGGSASEQIYTLFAVFLFFAFVTRLDKRLTLCEFWAMFNESKKGSNLRTFKSQNNEH